MRKKRAFFISDNFGQRAEEHFRGDRKGGGQ